VSLAVTVAGQHKQASRRNSSPVSSAQLARAKTVFAQNCARCHGADGRGETALGKELEATNLTDAEWHKKVSDKRLIQSVTRGRAAMPALEKLSTDDITALCAYVRTLKSKLSGTFIFAVRMKNGAFSVARLFLMLPSNLFRARILSAFFFLSIFFPVLFPQ
jgi:cytochrome c553